MSEGMPTNSEEDADIGGWIVPEGKEPHPVVWEAGEQAHSLIDQGNYQGAERIIIELLKTKEISEKLDPSDTFGAIDVLHDLVINEAENEKDAMRLEVNDILTKVNGALYEESVDADYDDLRRSIELGEDKE